MTSYYTLIGRAFDEDNDSLHVWEIIFGDYDRETVEQQKQDIRDEGGDIEYGVFKIICTGDKQEQIQAPVDKFNKQMLIQGIG